MSIYDGDIKIALTDGEGSIEYVAGNPRMDAGLSTAITISLFTERGWWGNEKGQEIGCDLMEKMRCTMTPKAILDIEEEARGALAWLVSEGIAESVTVSTEILGVGILALIIVVQQPAITTALTKRYNLTWGAQAAYEEAA